jgi:predicted Zn-dependent protease
MGLIAHCKTEADLAFVISHEIGHFKLQHGFETYKYVIRELNKKEKKPDFQKLETSLKKYSREKELKADAEGLIIFNKSKYHSDGVKNVMEILSFSDYPFANLEINREHFQSDFYRIP